MSKSVSNFSIARQESLKFGLFQIIEHFGLWLVLGVIKVVVTGIRCAAWLAFASVTALYLFEVSPIMVLRQPELGSMAMGMGGVQFIENVFTWISLSTLTVAFLSMIVLDLLGGILLMGIVQIAFDVYEKKKTSFSRLFACTHLAFHHFIASFLYKICVTIGAILFIIPGVVVGTRFWFYRQVIVDKEVGPIQALRQSAQITEGGTLQLLLFLLLLWFLISFVIGKGLGIVIALPFALLANAFVYKKLA